MRRRGTAPSRRWRRPTTRSDPTPAIELRDDVDPLAEEARLETRFVDARSLVLDFFEGASRTDPRIDAENEGRDLVSLVGRFLDALRAGPAGAQEGEET